jgi:hypothetical protein
MKQELRKGALLLACSTWLVAHRILLNRGFTLRGRGLSTDTRISLLIGATATFWSATVVVADLLPIYQSTGVSLPLIASFVKAPFLAQILFVFWLVSWTDGLLASRRDTGHFYLWSLLKLNGAFDWTSGVTWPFSTALYIAICSLVAIPSFAAFADGQLVPGILGLLSCSVFLASGVGNNPYVDAPHWYANDVLRIVLPTSHHEGTVYILPSTGHGIDAVWSPKVANEYIEADEQIMRMFQNMRSGRWSPKEPLERIRTTLAAYQRRVIINAEHINNLAIWLYEPSAENMAMRTIKCERAPRVHLIGRDLMYALCHAEYLVFMGQGRLSQELRQKAILLRLLKRSGGVELGIDESTTIGFRPGFAGYREAVEYVYKLFDQPLDELAVSFSGCSPPKYSSALSKAPKDIDEYVAELWDLSCTHSESTFTALYMFTTVWFIELGNVNGFHIFPLRCRNRNGDLISQQIVWRQAWYCGLIAQLIASSPAFLGAYIIDYLR